MSAKYYLVDDRRPVMAVETEKGLEFRTWDFAKKEVVHDPRMLSLVYTGMDRAGNEYVVEEVDESAYRSAVARLKKNGG